MTDSIWKLISRRMRLTYCFYGVHAREQAKRRVGAPATKADLHVLRVVGERSTEKQMSSHSPQDICITKTCQALLRQSWPIPNTPIRLFWL